MRYHAANRRGARDLAGKGDVALDRPCRTCQAWARDHRMVSVELIDEPQPHPELLADFRGVSVDAWMIHPSRRLLKEEMFAPLRAWLGEGAPDVDLAASATVDALDQAGFELGVVTAWCGPGGALVTNDDVARVVEASGGRLVGVASVDLYRPLVAVRELRRAVRELGFRALRIQPWLWGLPPNDRRYYPLYVECVELGIPFCTQVGQTGPARSSEPGRPIPYLEDVALDFPELTIVAGHIGAPWTEEMIALARRFPSVNIATSAYAAHRYPPALVEYLRSRGGRRKVIFGSGFPVLAPGRALERLGELGLDDEARELFLGGNARRVFSL